MSEGSEQYPQGEMKRHPLVDYATRSELVRVEGLVSKLATSVDSLAENQDKVMAAIDKLSDRVHSGRQWNPGLIVSILTLCFTIIWAVSYSIYTIREDATETRTELNHIGKNHAPKALAEENAHELDIFWRETFTRVPKWYEWKGTVDSRLQSLQKQSDDDHKSIGVISSNCFTKEQGERMNSQLINLTSSVSALEADTKGLSGRVQQLQQQLAEVENEQRIRSTATTWDK